MNQTNKYHFSVIVPTYRDWTRLNACVDALLNQDYPSDKFEVVIVNNDPEDNYILVDRPDNVLLIKEVKPGSYAARNAALSIVQGDIIAFTDSDCVPDKHWLKNAHQHFIQDYDRVAGKVEIFYLDDSKKSCPELYESVFAFDQKRNVQELKASITANLFVKRECFERTGTFDDSKKSGEDFGWNRRANKLGFSLFYAEDVLVMHPARRSYKELSQKKRRVFGGKKNYKFNSLKNIIKEILYPFYLAYGQFVLPTAKVWKSKSLTLAEKFKVTWVVFYLCIIVEIEFFRLLFSNNRQR